MHMSEMAVSTQSASQYLQQLCKHFAHKVTVEYDAHNARVDFPFGECRMTAREDVLRFVCSSPTPEAEEQMHAVIGDHLVKFAWRETLDLNWRPSEARV
jgi:uncharacterized protein